MAGRGCSVDKGPEVGRSWQVAGTEQRQRGWVLLARAL